MKARVIRNETARFENLVAFHLLKACHTWTEFIASLILSLLVFAGCSGPECREVKPVEVVEEELIEKIDDRLDDIDATDEQKKAIFSMVRAFMPEYEANRTKMEPKINAVLRELQKQFPDRETVYYLFMEISSAYGQFSYRFVDIIMKAVPVMSHEQRKELLKEEMEPREPFEGSFMLDRSVDVFLFQIEASREQKQLTIELKDTLIAMSQPLQKELERLRLEMIKELTQENPDREKIVSSLAAYTRAIQKFAPEVISYYLKWHAGLKPSQKDMIHSYIKRFEPCSTQKD